MGKTEPAPSIAEVVSALTGLLGEEVTSESIGVGIDLESVARFNGEPPERLFTETELEAARRSSDPAEHLAGRFCVKEAVVKATSRWGQLGLRQVETTNTPEGRPSARILSEELDDVVVEVSIAHSAGMAVAIALATRIPPGPSRHP